MDQPEQDVLGADVIVVEEPRFFLCEDDHPAGPIGEPFEQLGPSFVSASPGSAPMPPLDSSS